MNDITLIIPDIHLKIDLADKIIKSVNPDRTIFLGDLFDDFNDTPEMVKKGIKWFNRFIKNERNIFIFGNHEHNYCFSTQALRCSGYAHWKYEIINKKVPWSKLVYHYILDNTFLITHAGLHKFIIPSKITKLYKDRSNFYKNIDLFLDEQTKNGISLANEDKNSLIFGAGFIRRGSFPCGGITWCDNREFVPTKGLNQIFGHTPSNYVRWTNLIKNTKTILIEPNYSPSLEELNNSNFSFNLCLDTNLYHFVTWDKKELKIHTI